MPIDDLEEHPIRDTVGRRIAIDELAACAELRDRYPNEPRIKRPPAAIGRRVRGLPGATGAP